MANKRVVPGSLTAAYRKGEADFSPDLVGFQLTKGTPLFTLGNFGITTNIDPKPDTEFNTGIYSNEFTLENLDLTEQQSRSLVSNSIYTTLNLDPTDLSRYAYYGSFVQFLRVSLEGIVSKWKGSIYVTDETGGYSSLAKNTLLGYSYNSLTNESQITIPTVYIENKFNLTTNDLGGIILDPNDISNIKLSFNSYEISNDYGNFEVLGYTGDTININPTITNNPYLKIIVKGEAFPPLTGSTFGTFKYHLKPKDLVVDRLFFDTLSDFENILLNRLVTPKYTSMFEAPMETESGTLLSVRKSFTWPTTDGFNLDTDTSEYGAYINGVLKMGIDYDRIKGSLITRRYVSKSISEFDTNDGTEDESQGRKVNKLLTIYGREFDEVKKYTDGIRFANIITYNKKDNAPDELIKNLAKAMGFEAIKSVTDNKLLSYIAKSNQAVFSGQSRSMSTQEIDTELWRRLVINAYWLFKSKGSRKVIEFFIKLFGLGECLINFDECVYVVDNKLDVEETFLSIEQQISGNTIFNGIPTIGQVNGTEPLIDRSLYPIDEQGFPKILPETQDYYFQMNGFWYNNGTQRTTGNNPHYGPYDYGSKYFEKFSCFIDDFSGRTETTLQTYTDNVNLFPDYNNGDIEITFEDGKPLMDYGDTYAQIMTDNDRVSEMTHLIGAGFSTENSRTGLGSLKLTFNCGDDDCAVPCPNFVIDSETGLVLVQPSDPKEQPTIPLDEECCAYHGFDYEATSFSEEYKKTLSDEALKLLRQYEEILKKKYQGNIGTTSCFWCLPALPICDFTAYFETLIRVEGVQGLIDLLIQEGLLSPDAAGDFLKQWNSSDEEAKKELSTIIEYYNKIYEKYCLIVDVNFGEVSEECCKIRGGEWINLSLKEEASGTISLANNGHSFKCLIPKDIPPPPTDPCLCELPTYCDFKKPLLTMLYNGYESLEQCVPATSVWENITQEMLVLWGTWRGQRDAYIKSQFLSVLQGGAPGTTVPIQNLFTGNLYTPTLPTPVIGLEYWTGIDSWQEINFTQGCLDEYYCWVSTLDSNGNPILNNDGNPSGQITCPCPSFIETSLNVFDPTSSNACDGFENGTVLSTDYEDVAGTNRQKLDAALKAKNEWSLATMPFFAANEFIPYYQINKCLSDCGKDCTTCVPTLQPLECEIPVGEFPTYLQESVNGLQTVTIFGGVSQECCTSEIMTQWYARAYPKDVIQNPDFSVNPTWGPLPSGHGDGCYWIYQN